MANAKTLLGFELYLRELQNDSGSVPTILPDGPEPWEEKIARLHTPDQINQISEETFHYFLEVLPPRWMGGGAFVFCEGAEPLRLFWSVYRLFFCRQLTEQQTTTFCKFAQISNPLEGG
jgi:hypothetical protein